MSEWREFVFKELFDIPLKNGLNKPSKVRGAGFRMVNMKEIFGYDFIGDETPMELVPLTENEKVFLQNGDLLFARQSLVASGAGKIAYYRGAKPTVFESHLIRCRINTQIANPLFIYYLIKSPHGRGKIETIVEQTAAAGIRGSDLKELKFYIPHLPTQTAIAEILSSLDDKIELNNRINQELENLAQTLFKRWFIDFEFPNENGEPYKSAGGEMVDSELGEIPKGWDVVLLSELLTIKYGKDHKHLSDGVYPVYGSGGIMRYVERPLYKNNSILIPRKGTLSNLFYIEEPFWSVDTMFYTEIHNPIYGKYLFHYIKILDIASMNVGSAVPSMTKTILNELRILNPNNIALQEYDNVVSGFYNLMNQFKRESAELTNLRNKLLPKLISGELEVNQTIN